MPGHPQSASRHALGVESSPPAFPQTFPDFSEFLRAVRNKILPTAPSTTTPRRNSLASAAKSKNKSGPFINHLRGYLRRLSEGGSVQDELITIRGERS